MPTRWSQDSGARALIRSHERSVPDHLRRTGGVYYTPDGVAAQVLDLAIDSLGGLPGAVSDPACGSGAFLLTVAERLVAEGVGAREVLRSRLSGIELDPQAATTARQALSHWAAGHGELMGPEQIRIHQGDALQIPAEHWPGRPDDGFDLVIGNPPFLNQLSLDTARDPARRAAVARRFGPLGAYTDDAGLFLLLGLELLADGGVVAMIQPQSVLSARDAAPVRARLRQDGRLVALWAHLGTPFPDADVHVCAPVVRRRMATPADSGPSTTAGAQRAAAVEAPGVLGVPVVPEVSEVSVVPGQDWVQEVSVVPGQDRVQVVWDDEAEVHRGTTWLAADAPRWGALLGAARGIPDTPPLRGRPLSEVATATAGFRDEFYALCEAMRVAASDESGERPDAGSPRLVTVGMIDPMLLRHHSAQHRIGGAKVTAPTVDMAALTAAHPRIGRWAAARLRPKVLVATQTRIVEAVADPEGDCVPMTPTISVEPIDDLIGVWHLVAALGAPPVAAIAVREHLGAGRSASALRWSAAGVLEVSLPVDDERWDRGAALARELHGHGHGHGHDHVTATTGPVAHSVRQALLDEFGSVMTEAHGLAGDHPVVAWWSELIPRR